MKDKTKLEQITFDDILSGGNAETLSIKRESRRARDCYECVCRESHRCYGFWRSGKNGECPDGLHYEKYKGSRVRQCLCAAVEIYQDGYIHCPVIRIGCEECEKNYGDGEAYPRWEDQNYERKPRGSRLYGRICRKEVQYVKIKKQSRTRGVR